MTRVGELIGSIAKLAEGKANKARTLEKKGCVGKVCRQG